MKIAKIETLRIEEFPNLLWLRVHTDEGLIGLGETFMGPRTVEASRPRTGAFPAKSHNATTISTPFSTAPTSWRRICSQKESLR